MNTTMTKRKALIAMSGGVDSSAAAFLMQREGFDCVGAIMRLRDGEACGGDSDTEAARAVAERLGMPFYVFDFAREFSEQVVDRFVCAYLSGETPNPCIDCNRFLKFGAFLRMADELGCEVVVTGHYARVERTEQGRYLLKKALDPRKDQSYVLASLSQEQLARVRFPLGTYSKPEIRQLAEDAGLINARRRDSQDICFVPDGDYASFIERRTGSAAEPGNFVLEDGTVVGRHRGLLRYTLGQRKGLGIAWKTPLYVLCKDAERNEVVLSENAALFTRELTAREFRPGAADTLRETECTAMTRYQAAEVPCTATLMPDGSVRAVFSQPVRAVTPGQTVVFYNGDTVLASAVIC